MAKRFDQPKREHCAAEIEKAYHAGERVGSVATRLGISGGMAYNLMKEFGIETNRALYGRDETQHTKRDRNFAIVAEYMIVGTRKAELARKYGITRQRIQQIIDHAEYSKSAS